MKVTATNRRKKGTRGVNIRVLLILGLMIISFAAGMLTQRAITRPPQQDANLSYIDDIPVYTDFLPEGSRARPGQTREIKYLVIHETDNFSAGADAAGLLGRAGLSNPFRWDALNGQWQGVFPTLPATCTVTVHVDQGR